MAEDFDELVLANAAANNAKVENENAIEEPLNETPAVENINTKPFLEINYTTPAKNETNPLLSLPSSYSSITKQKIEEAANVKLADTDESRKWAGVITSGLRQTMDADIFTETLNSEESNYRQFMDHNNKKIGGIEPKLPSMDNAELSGERGVIRILSALGLGTLFTTPLWHTGIWITFKAPTESAIIELNRTLVSDKIRFGRATYSLAFSNLTSYTTDRLVKFALQHIYDTTIKLEDNEKDISTQLCDLISCQDIPSILWGLVCTMYPNGFQYSRSCINDPERCSYVVEELLAVNKLQWVDNKGLSDWQKTHMSIRRAGSKSLADVTHYKEQLLRTQSKQVEIETGSGVNLDLIIKTPSITEHIDAGQRWVGQIIKFVEETLESDKSESDRNAYIIQHGQATAMRQYSHWVESIEIGTNTVKDRESIEDVLNGMSASDSIRSSFIKSVINYINGSTISVIGIPVFDCPKCGMGQEINMLPRHTDVIPLDVHQLFFALATQRIKRIEKR
jgi:hypothetical protein